MVVVKSGGGTMYFLAWIWRKVGVGFGRRMGLGSGRYSPPWSQAGVGREGLPPFCDYGEYWPVAGFWPLWLPDPREETKARIQEREKEKAADCSDLITTPD
jgi:hypothetical protein